MGKDKINSKTEQQPNIAKADLAGMEKELKNLNEASKGPKKKFSFFNLILVLILLLGVGIMAYPTFSDWWNSFHQSRAIAGYVEQTAKMDEKDIEAMWKRAEDYNAALLEKTNRYILSPQDKKEYNSILDVTGNGIMGYIEIPRIKVSLPIYHGTNESVLQIAIGHLEGSSFPVGGKGTHALLSGHRGLPSAKLFTDIDQLEKGDKFTLQILDRTLTYEVDQIRTVLPDELQDLDIDPDQDYVTLITCTPYGINTHRLLVRGHRVANEYDDIRVMADAMQYAPVVVAPLVGAPLLLILLILTLNNSRSNLRKKERKALIRAVVDERSQQQKERKRRARKALRDRMNQ